MQKQIIKIGTWNINSINVRIGLLLKWIEKYDPDIILLQEIKCLDKDFPYQALEDTPYNILVEGQKSYHGVAILSKFPIDKATSKSTFLNNPCIDARYLEVTLSLPIGLAKVISLYAPNGSDVGSEKFTLKLNFFENFNKHLIDLKRHDEFLIIGGDFNIATEDKDVHDVAVWEGHTCFTLPERKYMRSILNQGFIDTYRFLNPEGKDFTWWNYRKPVNLDVGIRIDSIISSTNLADYLEEFFIHKSFRFETRPSDHAPCMLSLRI
jgi:exodeoxyribonuclease-3